MYIPLMKQKWSLFAAAWGDDLVWQECQNHGIHPLQEQAEKDANGYLMLKDTTAVPISNVFVIPR